MNINNVEEEQKMLSELNALTKKYGNSTLLEPEKQKRYFDELLKKILFKNVYRLDMQVLFTEDAENYPSKSILDWINCFAYVRDNARYCLDKSIRYGTAMVTDLEKKYEKNRPKKHEFKTNSNPNQNSDKSEISEEFIELERKNTQQILT
jgi:hypothetical protein